MDLISIYNRLFELHGPQGWWPLVNHNGVNPTKAGSVNGYHPGDYSFPHNDLERFEICVGAILTQNTAWPNVEKALIHLEKLGALSAKRLLELDEITLKEAIRPAGYFNQKAKKLRIFASYYLGSENPSRDDLLQLWGIGPETADSILLYAYHQPQFVVDTYTKRIMSALGVIEKNASYDVIKEIFESSLPNDVPMYQEFHALLVEHAKQFYSKNSRPCPLRALGTNI